MTSPADHVGDVPAAVNLGQVLRSIQQCWTPHIIASVNNMEFKLARLCGEFVWHAHAHADEAFLVLQGSLTIRLEDGDVHLQPGELFVVPRGVRHQPVAIEECQVLLAEKANTLNTGDAEGDSRSTRGIQRD